MGWREIFDFACHEDTLRYNANELMFESTPKDALIMLDEKLLDEIVERLQKIDPLRIFLFGSQVTETTNADSDIDLLVIKNTVASSIKETNEARKLLRGLGKPFDIVVSTQEEFDFYRNQVNSVHHAAANYGRLLYG